MRYQQKNAKTSLEKNSYLFIKVQRPENNQKIEPTTTENMRKISKKITLYLKETRDRMWNWKRDTADNTAGNNNRETADSYFTRHFGQVKCHR